MGRSSISFKISNVHLSHALADLKSHRERVAYIEAHFTFLIDEKVVLDESDWNIIEFAEQLTSWEKNDFKGSFIYRCMDTNDEEIFCLIEKETHYLFHSSWSLSEANTFLTLEEIKVFTESYKNEIFSEVLHTLNIKVNYQ